MGLREELLGQDVRKIEELRVERLQKTLRVRELNGDARDRITSLYLRHTPVKAGELTVVTDVPLRLHETYIVLGVVDESGNRVFKDKDVDVLADVWPGEVVKFVADAIERLSGMAAADLEEARKNSESEGSSDSGSASLATLDGQ